MNKRITKQDLERIASVLNSIYTLPVGFAFGIDYAYGGTKLVLRHNYCVYKDTPGYHPKRKTYENAQSNMTGWVMDAWTWAARLSEIEYHNTGKRQTVTSADGRVKLVTSGRGFVLYLHVGRKTPARHVYSLSDPWSVGRAVGRATASNH